jgi:hypothetical protein
LSKSPAVPGFFCLRLRSTVSSPQRMKFSHPVFSRGEIPRYVTRRAYAARDINHDDDADGYPASLLK